jgi:BMFP domain-containing protein YqiC
MFPMVDKDKVLDGIARVAGGTVEVISGIGKNIRSDIRSRAEEMATRLDLVPREDFDRLQAVLEETRRRVEAQDARIAALESGLRRGDQKTGRATPRKTQGTAASKKPSASGARRREK